MLKNTISEFHDLFPFWESFNKKLLSLFSHFNLAMLIILPRQIFHFLHLLSLRCWASMGPCKRWGISISSDIVEGYFGGWPCYRDKGIYNRALWSEHIGAWYDTTYSSPSIHCLLGCRSWIPSQLALSVYTLNKSPACHKTDIGITDNHSHPTDNVESPLHL